MLTTANVRVPAAATRHQANPVGLFFNNSFGNIELYPRAGAMVMAGNCNRYDPRFRRRAAAGAEVLAYLNPIEVYDHIPCKLNEGFYMGGPGSAPMAVPGARRSCQLAENPPGGPARRLDLDELLRRLYREPDA